MSTMKVSVLSLLALLVAVAFVGGVDGVRAPVSASELDKAEDSLDSAEGTPEQSGELKKAQADVELLTAKVAAGQAKYDLAAKPFKASERLQDLERNATDAEEKLQDTENEFEAANDTVIEDRKEENTSHVLFSKANVSDVKLRKKVVALRMELAIAEKKEAKVKEAHNLTLQAYKAHRLADAKIKLSAQLKEDADAVTARKADLLEERKKLKAQLVDLKVALHGEDPHTKDLLITIRTERLKLHELKKNAAGYQIQKDILDNAIRELYDINGKKPHVVAMKKEAQGLAKAIKVERNLVADAEERVHQDAGFLQEMAKTGQIPQGFIDTAAAGLFNEKALFLKDVAAALNVSGIRKTLTALAKKFQKRHNTTLKKALGIYNETLTNLRAASKAYDTLADNLTSARAHFKVAKRAANTVGVAERAQHELDKAQAHEVLREAQIGLKLAKERVERAKEVLSALNKALAASSATQDTIDGIMSKPEPPISPGIKTPTLNPPASPEPTPASASPLAGAVDKLVQQAVWGQGTPEAELASAEGVLRASFQKKQSSSNGTSASAGAMKFKQVDANVVDTVIPGIKAPDHCLDGKRDFDEAGVDCGGSCPRKCGMFHVQTEKGTSRDSQYHVVTNVVPNKELVGSETLTPTYVKSLKDLLVPGADVTTKARSDSLPIMNDGKFQPTHHRFKEFRMHSKLKHHLRHRIHHHRHHHHHHHHRK